MFCLIPTLNNGSWLDAVTREILEQLQKQNCGSTRKSVLLTGGFTAKKLYEHLSSENIFTDHDIDFYFGDERCVPPEDPDSNYGMVLSTLFASGIPEGCRVYRMRGEQKNLEYEAVRYASILPDSIDVLLLSVGEDGHIASIFPHSETVSETFKKICLVVTPKPPPRRLTITAKVLNSAKNIIVFVCGKPKGKVVAKALEQPQNVQEYPIGLVIGKPETTIILDKEASEQLQ